MIEELKALVAVISGLPQMALWVAVGFWAYKVIIIGSVYGVIKMIVNKLHGAVIAYLQRGKTIDAEVLVKGMVITGRSENLIEQLSRLIKKNQGLNYIHDSDIDWLSIAITEKEIKDGKKND